MAAGIYRKIVKGDSAGEMSGQEDLMERARRLREQIERMKSGRAIRRPDQSKSLREQIEERSNRLRPRRKAPKSP
jgi:hypothetical protein